MNYKGKAHKVGEHIDTDAIIPARFLVTTDAKKLGENCMSGLEPDWVKRVAPGDILVADGDGIVAVSRDEAEAVAVQARAIRDTGLRKLKAIEKTGKPDFNWLYEKLAASSCAIFN